MISGATVLIVVVMVVALVMVNCPHEVASDAAFTAKPETNPQQPTPAPEV